MMDKHLTKEEIFDGAYVLWEKMNETCPGCTMGVISTLMSMLATTYIKEEAKEGRIFDIDEWIRYITDATKHATEAYERHGVKTH